MVKGKAPPAVGEVRRGYDSPGRRERADATAAAVLDAAHELFLEQGYAGTTIVAIATRAGVSAETIYATFSNKRSLLRQLLDRSIAGDDRPVPILERDWVTQLRDEPEMATRIRLLAREGAQILARRSPVDRVLRDAASADAAIAAMWRSTTSQRLEGQRHLVHMVVGPNQRYAEAQVAAITDSLFAIGSPEVYQLLVGDRGWSIAQFAAWYEAMLLGLFLDRPSLV